LQFAEINMPQTNLITLRREWQEAWQETSFRRKLITGLLVVALIAMAFPIFFQSIEKRNGIVVNDLLLNVLPPYDVSVPIFIASVKDVAPVGKSMNSWKASLLPACEPPLMTLKAGVGRTNGGFTPARSARC